MAKLRIDIWSDIACPWCYIGKRHLEQALSGWAHAGDVEIVWRAFELDPSAPKQRTGTQAELLAGKYGMSPAQARDKLAQMTEVAAKDGLAFDFDKVRGGNTFDAHRVLHLAHERGAQDAVKERLMRGYFGDGLAVGDPAALEAAAVEAGLDRAEVKEVLAGDRYAQDVRTDERLARELGISGVPFFVLGGKLGVSGAQPAAVLRGALDQAWADAGGGEDALVEGAACGPDGCA